MVLQAYLPSLQGFRYKASAQQIYECCNVLSILLQEKEEESLKDKDTQAPYD